VEDLAVFVGALPEPRRARPDDVSDDDLAIGEFLFEGIGCATCHTPNVGEVHGIYSDLLLHRVGTSGLVYYHTPAAPPGDVVSGERLVPVAADEFRTPPLWGVADSAPYMHDGGAYTLHAAIVSHRGQATSSSRNYLSLTELGRQRLIAFLKSLRAPTP
jgi:CxxC motif-containing protein (DUF1111 family)